MRNIFRLLAFSLLFTYFLGCSGRKIKVDESKVTKNEFISFNVTWIKDKGKHYDIEIAVTNISQNDIIFMLPDMQCFKGKAQGVLKHTFFNTGERTIDFRRGQMKKFKMVCTLPGSVEGNYRIVVGRIYDNPNSDGATKGKVLTENVELKIEPDSK